MNSQKQFEIDNGTVFHQLLKINNRESVILIVPYRETLKQDEIHLTIFCAELDSNSRELVKAPVLLNNTDALSLPAKDEDLENLIKAQAESIANVIRLYYKQHGISQKEFDDLSIDKWNCIPLQEMEVLYPFYKDFFSAVESKLPNYSNFQDYLKYLKEINS